MICLILASLIWSISFGLIGNTLVGLPRAWLAASRLLISTLLFLPFLKRIPPICGAGLFATGAIQFGLMYLAYMHSFNYLQSHEVVLFTIFTPLYVSLINDCQQRSFNRRNLLTASLAVAGSAVILRHNNNSLNSMTGFALVQLSGIFFALGQLLYRSVFNAHRHLLPDTQDHHVFAWMYAGGLTALAPLAALEISRQPPQPTVIQLCTVAYLGVIASGVAFFLWNKGARKVSADKLAVMNNLKIPMGAFASLFLFGETFDLTALICGTLLICAALYTTTFTPYKRTY